MERKQFTFFHSFREALALIDDPLERVQAYDIIADYALDGIEPQWNQLPKIIQMAFLLIKPTLDSSKEKARIGAKGGTAKQSASTTEANCKQPVTEDESEKEKEIEIEKEIEKDTETETETENKGSRKAFEWFWSVYPKQIGKEEAYKAFECITEPTDVLVEAVRKQIRSPQWQKEGGRYIPNPATWLKNKRWTDIPARDPNPYNLSDFEVQAIKRIMKNPAPPT